MTLEPPIESLHETIHEHAHGNHESHDPRSRWILGVALTSALIAGLGAIAALMAEHHASESMSDQIQAADQWNFYQAKSIKSALVTTRVEILKALGKEENPKDEEKIKAYEKEQEEIKANANEKEKSSREHLARHVALSRSVTLFQVAVAVAAIAVLTRRKFMWFLSMGFGLIGIFFIFHGM